MKTVKQWTFRWLMLTFPILSLMACALVSAQTLNDGKGTRDEPVPARMYAKTIEYEVRAMSVVWLAESDRLAANPQYTGLRVQFQIRCDATDENEVCELEKIARDIKLADTAGVLYDPVFDQAVEKPLEGEILSQAEKMGWLAYEVPRGVEISAAVALYGSDLKVFFELPRTDE